MAKTVSNRDLYLDDEGNVTDDEKKAAQQIAFKGAAISPLARDRWNLNEDGSDAKPAKKADKADKPDDEEEESKTLKTDSVKRASSAKK